jgi:membrane protease YdiL (CAAX protease family)
LLFALIVGLTVLVTGLPLTHLAPQTMGMLGATAGLLLLAWRLGWLRAAGIARLGFGTAWLITLLAGLYLLWAYIYGFYARSFFDLSTIRYTPEVGTLIWRSLVVGVAEEMLFRGVLLYALVRVWGNTRRGLLASLILPAVIFSLIHILQALAGQPISVIAVVLLNTFISSLWWGALVLFGGSIWPAVVLHACSNLVVQIWALYVPTIEPAAWAYTRATLLELPLLLMGIFLLMRISPRSVVPDTP